MSEKSNNEYKHWDMWHNDEAKQIFPEGYTPTSESLSQNKKYGVLAAVVFGAVVRLSFEEGHSYASASYIAKKLGMSYNTVRKYLQLLEGKNTKDEFDSTLIRFIVDTTPEEYKSATQVRWYSPLMENYCEYHLAWKAANKKVKVDPEQQYELIQKKIADFYQSEDSIKNDIALHQKEAMEASNLRKASSKLKRASSNLNKQSDKNDEEANQNCGANTSTNGNKERTNREFEETNKETTTNKEPEERKNKEANETSYAGNDLATPLDSVGEDSQDDDDWGKPEPKEELPELPESLRLLNFKPKTEADKLKEFEESSKVREEAIAELKKINASKGFASEGMDQSAEYDEEIFGEMVHVKVMKNGEKFIVLEDGKQTLYSSYVESHDPNNQDESVMPF